jgi:hemerythrin-like metal-binding protein
MLMLWTNNLSVGVKELDEWNKRLIRMINELHYAILDSADSGVIEKEEIEIVLHRLENYARYHCSREESLLATIGYVDLEEQKEQHHRLAEGIADMSKRFHNSTDPRDGAEIMRFIYDWVTNHIYVTDRKFIEPLKKRPDVLR